MQSRKGRLKVAQHAVLGARVEANAVPPGTAENSRHASAGEFLTVRYELYRRYPGLTSLRFSAVPGGTALAFTLVPSTACWATFSRPLRDCNRFYAGVPGTACWA